ncbi:MAG: hypothetical protein EHM81_11150 [Chloroflexi bacterium]|nr:MAG: hypothetical protein EHM81_11150 [Chloroflexota bacterium]
MPQLAKGGKWVFGWVVVGPDGEIRIPPEAYTEYGLQPGETVFFMKGSRRSGGFGLGKSTVLSTAPILPRKLAQGKVTAAGTISLPPEAAIQPGERLLAYRGSGLALGFLQRGPIHEEALRHPELEIFIAG